MNNNTSTRQQPYTGVELRCLIDREEGRGNRVTTKLIATSKDPFGEGHLYEVTINYPPFKTSNVPSVKGLCHVV